MSARKKIDPVETSYWQREIENFLGTYKTLEGVRTEILGWEGVEVAWQIIGESTVRAQKLDNRSH